MRRNSRTFTGLDIDAIHVRNSAISQPEQSSAKLKGRPRSVERPVGSEHLAQAAVFQWWCMYAPTRKIDTLLLLAIPNSQILMRSARNPHAVMDYLRKEGFRDGAPDYFLAYPTRDYAGLFIEQKLNYKRKPTPSQNGYKIRLRSVGYRSEVCYGADAAIKLIQEYLK